MDVDRIRRMPLVPMRRPASGVVVAGIMGFLLLVPCQVATSADVVLRVGGGAVEPGEELAVEFEADLAVPIINLIAFIRAMDGLSLDRVDVAGTETADTPPSLVHLNAEVIHGQVQAGFERGWDRTLPPIGPGQGLVLFRAIFRVNPRAETGHRSLSVDLVDASVEGWLTASVQVESVGDVIVLAPTGPRPVSELACVPGSGGVRLSWNSTEDYDAVEILRGGRSIAVLSGDTEEFEDRPPPGLARYAVVPSAGGRRAVPAYCRIDVDVPRPSSVSDISCEMNDGIVLLTWTNGEEYDEIEVLRNSMPVATLEGGATSWSEPVRSDLFVVYTVRPTTDGVRSLPGSCFVNELGDSFSVRVENVAAAPGDLAVPLRVFVTNPQPLAAISLALRLDPERAVIRDVSWDGTASEVYGMDFARYRAAAFPDGEIVVGIVYDMVPPKGDYFAPGSDQHALTVLVDIPSTTPSGTEVPVEFGRSSEPTVETALTLPGSGNPEGVRLESGSILVGESPVPPVANLRLQEPETDAKRTLDTEIGSTIRLAWATETDYERIRVERDGAPVAVLRGRTREFTDIRPGPGVHRYSVVAVQGDVESFPVELVARPQGIPGTFLRGDADRDERLGLTDAIVTLQYLFREGGAHGCLEALDTDDSGAIGPVDAVLLLRHLFVGGAAPPPPGPDQPWFDPTEDRLGCD